MMRSFVLAFFSLYAVKALNLPPAQNLKSTKETKKQEKKVEKVSQKKEVFDVSFSSEVLLAQKFVVPELTPSDFKQKVWINEQTLDTFAKCTFVGVLMAASGVLGVMYWGRGVMTAFAIIAYTLALSTMSIAIKNVFVNHSFGYPQFVTAAHGLATALVAFFILGHRQITTERKIAVPTAPTLLQGILPVALAFALSLGTGNLSLLYSNAHFYEMLSAMSVIATAACGVLMGRELDSQFLPPLMVCTLAIMIVAFGEVQFTFVGVIFCIASVVFRAVKAQLQSLLMAPGAMSQTFDPLELTLWTACLTFAVMITWSAVTEGLAPWKEFLNMGTVIAVLITCVNAVVLNVSGLFVMKELGPVAQQIIGNMKGVVACLGAVAAFGETITFQQISGYGICIIGAYWYNRVDVQLKAEAKLAEQKA